MFIMLLLSFQWLPSALKEKSEPHPPNHPALAGGEAAASPGAMSWASHAPGLGAFSLPF